MGKRKPRKKADKQDTPPDNGQPPPTDDRQDAPSDDTQDKLTHHRKGSPTDPRVVELIQALLKKMGDSDEKTPWLGPSEVERLLHVGTPEAKKLLAVLHETLFLLARPIALQFTDQSTKGTPGKLADRWRRLQALEVALEKLEGSDKQLEAQPTILTEEMLKEKLDLKPEAASGVLNDIRSYARRLAVGVGKPYYRRQRETNPKLKERIAEKVKDLIPAGVGVAISAGSTVEECLKVLTREGRYVRVMTNSLAIANNRSLDFVPGIEFSGGVFEPEVYAFVGDRAISAFKKAGFSYALVGVSGISGPDEGRLYVRHASELAVLWQMVTSAADGVIIVADAHKLGRTDEWHFSSIKQLLEDSSRNHLKVVLVTNDPSVIPDKDAERDAQEVYDGLQNLRNNSDYAARFDIVHA